MIYGLIFWLSAAAVVYVYLGYPLLVTLLARLRPTPVLPNGARNWTASQDPPTVTLLIAAYNEQEVIARKLENALGLDYPSGRLQILVAADGSDDHTVEIVSRFAVRGVELCYEPLRRGKMAAINRALPLVHHEILVFSDANNLYGRDALRELVAPFEDSSVGAVSGAKQIQKGDGALGESEGLYWKYESFLKTQETRLGICMGVSGEILAIRRGLYRPCPDGIINDDFFMALNVVQLGYRVVYAPRAISVERVSKTAGDEIARRSRIVAGRYQIMGRVWRSLPWGRPLVVWQVLSHKYLRPLVPFWMLLAIFANAAAIFSKTADGGWLALAFPYNWTFFALQAGFYLLAWLGSTLDCKNKLGKILYFPAFLVHSNFAAVLGLFRYLTGKQQSAWQMVARRESN